MTKFPVILSYMLLHRPVDALYLKTIVRFAMVRGLKVLKVILIWTMMIGCRVVRLLTSNIPFVMVSVPAMMKPACHKYLLSVKTRCWKRRDRKPVVDYVLSLSSDEGSAAYVEGQRFLPIIVPLAMVKMPKAGVILVHRTCPMQSGFTVVNTKMCTNLFLMPMLVWCRGKAKFDDNSIRQLTLYVHSLGGGEGVGSALSRRFLREEPVWNLHLMLLEPSQDSVVKRNKYWRFCWTFCRRSSCCYRGGHGWTSRQIIKIRSTLWQGQSRLLPLRKRSIIKGCFRAVSWFKMDGHDCLSGDLLSVAVSSLGAPWDVPDQAILIDLPSRRAYFYDRDLAARSLLYYWYSYFAAVVLFFITSLLVVYGVGISVFRQFGLIYICLLSVKFRGDRNARVAG